MIGEYVAKPDRVLALMWDGTNFEAAKELLGDCLLQRSGDSLIVISKHWNDSVEMVSVGQMVVVNIKAKEPWVQVMDVEEFAREYESV